MARITTAAQRRRKEIATAWMLLAPALIVMLIFTVYPVFRSVYRAAVRRAGTGTDAGKRQIAVQRNHDRF